MGNQLTLVQPGAGASTLTTTYGYDDANELHTIAYSDGTTHGVTYTYDDDGQRATMVDGTGTTTYTVDSLHRTTKIVNGAGATVQYGYDLDGDVTTLTYPGPHAVTRGFDDADRLTSVQDWLSHTSSFAYYPDGNLKTSTYANAVVGTNTYDNDNRIASITYAKGATTLSKYVYTEYASGLMHTATPSGGAPGTASTYNFNAFEQLSTTGGTGTWAYDKADRMTQNTAGTTFTYDTADELTKTTPTTGSATTYGYDNRGDRTSATVGTGTPTNYTYDQAQRLTQVTQGTSTWAYTFDGDGTRQSVKIGAAAATPWTWDPTTSLLLSDNTATFIYGPGGTPIEQVRGTTATYLHQDQLGSTVLITSQAGATADTYSYDPYGKVATHTGTTTTQLQYNGQYADTGTSLIYLRARSYDPATAEFVTEDPEDPATREPYGYAKENPLDRADPSGLAEIPIGGGEGIGGVLGGEAGIGAAAASGGGGGAVVDALTTIAECPVVAAEEAMDELTKSEIASVDNGAPTPYGPVGEDVWNVFERATTRGAPFPNTKGGALFENSGKGGGAILPTETDSGEPISYTKWDISPKLPNIGRDAERIVIGSVGGVPTYGFYTFDHYVTFTQFAGGWP